MTASSFKHTQIFEVILICHGFIKMNFFGQLPSLTLRKIYTVGNNDSKESLYNLYRAEKALPALRSTGVLAFGEEFHCPLCI